MSRIKRIQHATFRDSDLIIENPILLIGEIVFIISETTTDIVNYKVGDGVTDYITLPFKDISTYPHNDLVTNAIGDVALGANLVDTPVVDIIRDMVSPYVAPVVSNVRTNASGSYLNVAILEVGQSIGSAISVLFSVSNASNLVAIPMEVSAPQFIVANPYPNGAISLTPNGVIAPSQLATYTVQIRAIHTNGTTAYVSATIRFDARAIWGASNLDDLTTNQHALDLIGNGGGEVLKQSYAGEYEISTSGYGWVLLPSFFTQSGTPTWTEVSDPNAPASIGMVFKGVLSVNNGTGTYNYDKYRTPFSNLEAVKIKAT